MGARPTILVVDDDPHIREVVRFALEKASFTVVEAADGREALARFETVRPALVVLDMLMPELDGAEVCRRLRARSPVPIVILSSRDEEVDRIVGLELGADDYVTKPFSPRELVARVRAVLRRAAPGEEREREGPEPRPRLVSRNKLRLDLDRFQAFWGDREVALTVTEFGILKALLGYPGKVYSRDELMDGAYRDHAEITDRTIDSHVRRVRKKFAAAGGDPIETVHGLGYRIAGCE